MSTLVGIDIGATAVRVVGLSGLDGESYAKITRAATVPLQSGAVVGGSVQDPDVVAFALKQALKDAGVSAYGPVVGMSAQSTAISRVSVPAALTRHEWVPALRVANTQLSPKVPLVRSALSLYPLATGADTDGVASRTLLAAIALDTELTNLQKACRLARVVPKAIDLSGVAAMRCMVRTQPGNDDVSTLIDIGASKITIATRQGMHLRSLRTIDGGGEKLTRALMSATGLPFDRAEMLKLSMQLDAPGQMLRNEQVTQLASVYGSIEETKVNDVVEDDPALSALDAAADGVVEDIAAAIEADVAEFSDRPTEQLLLCGGGALLKGIKDRLVKRIGVPAIVARPWARVEPSKRTAHLLNDGTDDPLALHALTTAIGLAMWKEVQ